MQKNSTTTIIVVMIVVIAAIGAGLFFTMSNSKDNGVIGTDVDFVGRPIVPVENLDNGIAAPGQDSFRWMTYFGLADECVFVDTNDRTNFMGKSFMYVGQAQAQVDFNNLDDFTHANCNLTPQDVAHLLAIKPSLVVVPEGFMQSCRNEVDALIEGGLNVVFFGYIYAFLEPETFEITERLDQNINLLSKVLNMKDRGDEIKKFINDTVSDIRGISSTVTEANKKSGYIGALAYNGAHGSDSSTTFFIPFELAGVRNIMANEVVKVTESGVVTFSATAIKENMDANTILFLDATGMASCGDNTSKGIIELFKGHDNFVSFPYIWTGINYENVLIAAYQIMHDAYGLLTDAQLEAKINAVYDGFLGSHTSNREVTASTVAPPAPNTSIYEDTDSLYMARNNTHVYGVLPEWVKA
jgi:ABC-type Fe3+-hydroxamate transport system, periplasmic component